MPDRNAPRKPRRRWLWAPYILLALLAAAWSGGWFYLQHGVALRMDVEAAALRAQGYTVAWASRTIGGYPFRLSVNLTGATITEPSGYGLSAPVLEAESAAWTPNPVVVAAPQGVTIYRPGGRDFTVKGRILRASISHVGQTPPRISVEGVDLAFATPAGSPPLAFSAMQRFEVHIRPAPDDRAELFVRLDHATPSGDNILTRIAVAAPVTVGLEGAINGASFLKGAGWTRVLSNWSRAKGSLAIAKGGVEAGEAVLSARPSTLYLDADGSLAGDLSLSLTKAPQGVMALGAVGVLPHDTAAVAAGLAGVQGTGQTPLEASLTFRDGRTWLGPLELGPAPKLY